MKLAITFTLLLFALQTQAQRLTGMLMGEITRMPVVNAKVTAGSNAVLTNPSGVFVINIPPRTDSVRITAAGYTAYAIKPTGAYRTDTLVIYITPVGNALKQVNIKGTRSLKGDSLRLRKEFGTVFNYKSTKLTDALYKRRPPSKNIPYDYITSPNNATSIIGVDLLSVASLLSKKKDKTSHLQSILIQEEADNYSDKAFSQQKVSNITGLKGEPLRAFMIKYRPTNAQLKTMSDYELILYIKQRYSEFQKSQI